MTTAEQQTGNQRNSKHTHRWKSHSIPT